VTNNEDIDVVYSNRHSVQQRRSCTNKLELYEEEIDKLQSPVTQEFSYIVYARKYNKINYEQIINHQMGQSKMKDEKIMQLMNVLNSLKNELLKMSEKDIHRQQELNNITE